MSIMNLKLSKVFPKKPPPAVLALIIFTMPFGIFLLVVAICIGDWNGDIGGWGIGLTGGGIILLSGHPLGRIILLLNAAILTIEELFRLSFLVLAWKHGLYLTGGNCPVSISEVISHLVHYALPLLGWCIAVFVIAKRASVKKFLRG